MLRIPQAADRAAFTSMHSHRPEPAVFSGEWIDRIIGLENVTVETVMARAPDGSDVERNGSRYGRFVPTMGRT